MRNVTPETIERIHSSIRFRFSVAGIAALLFFGLAALVGAGVDLVGGPSFPWWANLLFGVAVGAFYVLATRPGKNQGDSEADGNGVSWYSLDSNSGDVQPSDPVSGSGNRSAAGRAGDNKHDDAPVGDTEDLPAPGKKPSRLQVAAANKLVSSKGLEPVPTQVVRLLAARKILFVSDGGLNGVAMVLAPGNRVGLIAAAHLASKPDAPDLIAQLAEQMYAESGVKIGAILVDLDSVSPVPHTPGVFITSKAGVSNVCSKLPKVPVGDLVKLAR
jgi:hypothetical protein